MSVVQKPIEQSRGQRCIIGKRRRPLSERQVAGQHHASALITFGDDIKEQRGFLATERQVANFIDDEQSGADDRTIEIFLKP